jgi:hypothetical protein
MGTGDCPSGLFGLSGLFDLIGNLVLLVIWCSDQPTE